LEPLNYGCPYLDELNLSGDSWVKKVCLLGVAKHRNIQIFHLGHFEHSDFKCQKVACEFPPKGFYIAGLFEKIDNFVNLRVLYLE
jgi:F-box/leucine-rich repeat protein 2/20